MLAQEESWETYVKKVETNLMEVTVNMDLYFERPNYKNLLIVATKTKHCYKNGFPKPTGLEGFYTFSDSLAFKIQTDPYVGRLTYIRVYSGKLKAGSYVINSTNGEKERVGRILLMHANHREELTEIKAGEIGADEFPSSAR